MATIHLTRISREGKAVRGMMRVNGRDIATIENADYIIPVGTYPVLVTFSPRFKRMLPLIGNVLGRSGIRIHRGTIPEHSKGCVLVNAAMEQELTAKWLALQASKEPIKITIDNENWRRRKRLGESPIWSNHQDSHAGLLPCRKTQKELIEAANCRFFYFRPFTEHCMLMDEANEMKRHVRATRKG